MSELSFLGKKWVFPSKKSVDDLRKARGIGESDFHSPGDLKDLQKAVERIQSAIKDGERILIVGDYDADGITASTILFKTFKELGAEASVRLPHRVKHGYGLNRVFVEEAKDLGVKLIITVDNGISAREEVKLANELGIDVIITDHHLPPAKLPDAFAILNPRQEDCGYPEKNLAGAAVAYKLATALLQTANYKLQTELLSLAAIGTLADVCPLTGENRRIVADGLAKIAGSGNVGLQRILRNAGIENAVSADDVGFRIAPRLNAAGRIDDPLIAFQVLANGGGEQFADQLEELNRQRQELTRQMFADTEEKLGEISAKKILIAGSTGWHPGVIGLTAGQLAEKYHRPAIIMSEKDGMLTGSCRSPLAEFNITAALNELSDLLTKFGGHRAAAGFTLERKNRAEFKKRLTEIAERDISETELTPTLDLDLRIAEEILTFDFLNELKTLAPFGEANPEPLLYWKSAPLTEVRAVGSDSSHLRLKVGNKNLTAIAFRFGRFLDDLRRRESVDLAFTLDVNEWNGSKNLQLRVVDMK